MIIGCPKEIKPQEGRVGLTPAGVYELVNAKHTVFVQKDAGLAAGFEDSLYVQAGAKILETAAQIYGQSEMIVKVKEPLAPEFDLIRPGQILFTYFHFASNPELTQAMIKSKAICIAYETVEVNRRLPLLTPMSEIAGRMSVQVGMRFLESSQGGSGVLLPGVPGVSPGRVVIIGAGEVGANAAKVAAGAGADVVLLDKSLERLRYLDDVLPKNCRTVFSCESSLVEELKSADLVIGAVLVTGCKTPMIVRREHLKLMPKGSVIVDVAVDHGGCVETTKITYHSNPTYVVDGVVHYGVANMPGSVPRTSTLALTNATLGYCLDIANKGWKQACATSEPLMKGLNMVNGDVTYKAVADEYKLPHVPATAVLGLKH